MKILHWNIHGWADADGVDNVDRVIDLVREVDPDVISLVEVDEDWGDPAKLRRVAETLDYCWAFVPAFEYREEGGFGNALLSKTPFVSFQQWHLLPPSLYDGSENSEPRTALVGCVEARPSLAIGSTHLSRSDRTMRRAACDKLLELSGLGDTQAWIVCGDFNQPAEEWIDSVQTTPRTHPATYPAKSPTERIDYVIFNRITPPRLEALSSDASDHLPITAKI